MRRCFLDPVAVVAMLVMAAGVAARVVQQEEPVVPVHQEPRHRLVFDSPTTRILDVQIPPGDTTLFHTHSDPILYVPISSSQTRSQRLGSEWSSPAEAARLPAIARPDNTVRAEAGGRPVGPRMYSVTTYVTEPLTHRVNNIGKTLFRLIGIINMTAGIENGIPSEAFFTRPEVNNRWFRSWRWSLGEDVGNEHRHASPVAIVLVAGRAEVSSTAETMLDKPGAFTWLEANTPHHLHSIEGGAEVAEVEVRRAH
jgi:hypothetical protein